MNTKPPSPFIPFLRRFTDERALDTADTKKLYKEVRSQFRRSAWSDPDALYAAAAGLMEGIEDRVTISDVLREPVVRCIIDLLSRESAIFDPAEKHFNIDYLSSKESVELRRFLRAKQHFLNNEERVRPVLMNAIVDLIVGILSLLPSDLPDQAAFKIPLSSYLPDLNDTADRIIGHICNAELIDNGFMTDLQQRLHLNACRVSGIDPTTETTKAFTRPSDARLAPQEMLRAYFDDTPFPRFFDAPLPFGISRKHYSEHGAIFAKSGHGKTQTLRSIVASFIQEDDPPALFVMDSLGSLIEGLDQLEVFAARLKDRLVIIDPTDAAPPALNFFKLQSDDLCFYLFKAIDQTFTPRQATMISYLMEFMRNVPEATLLTLVEVCEKKENPYPDVLRKLSPFAQSFFQNQFYAAKPDTLVQQTKSQIAQRIYTLGRLGKFTEMFSARENKFDPFRCMQEKKIVLINTDARPVQQGGLGEASSILGRFILAQCLDAARSRPKDKRHLALLVVDEAKHYMDEQAALILSDARQFGLGLLLATQFPHQLAEGVRKEINTNTSIKMMGPVEYAVASQYNKDMFTTPEEILSVRSYDRSHAEWMTYVANLTPRAVKLSVPFGAIEKLPRMDAEAHEALRAANMTRYGTLQAMSMRLETPATTPEAAPGRDPVPTAPPERAQPPAPQHAPAASPPPHEIMPGKKWVDD